MDFSTAVEVSPLVIELLQRRIASLTDWRIGKCPRPRFKPSGLWLEQIFLLNIKVSRALTEMIINWIGTFAVSEFLFIMYNSFLRNIKFYLYKDVLRASYGQFPALRARSECVARRIKVKIVHFIFLKH